ncbi:hypothetical protein [Bradyrhizobium sp. cf659]|uniref:hypothetical protein n=1 Tax=Bradyrhizobium sp. cf659 TaxID=1761771 RepID=UPI0008F01415|nr:hypothetical protein [Bradyrhizobium sp. cf659]SFI58765.1 hypothetical protein SAMN04487925_103379 [Bradyrhizobium sp. cf659]
MARAIIIGIVLLTSPAFAADDVLLRNMDTVLDFVGTMSANCVQHYDEGMTPKARAQLQFSQVEIAAYCVCSTKLLVRQMGNSDFQGLAVGNELPAKLGPILKQARFDCAKKVWDARKQGQNSADPNIPPAMKRLMDEAKEQVDADANGALGQKARDACGRRLGIAANAANGRDVARLYGAQKAAAWTDCVVETMYPSPAQR